MAVKKVKKGYFKYCDDVISGKRPASQLEIKAVKRFLKDVEDPRYYLDEKAADRAIEFCSLNGPVGQKGARLRILGWQQFIIANFVGLKVKATGLRKYRQAYLEIPRGQGKSTLIATLSLYFMIADGEPMADCFFVANSAKQAGETFRKACSFARILDPKNKELRICRDNIKFARTESLMLCLASDPNKLDGYNCYFGIVDEYHQAANPFCYEALLRSQPKRMGNSMVAVITTAGLKKKCACYELHLGCEKILNGEIENERMFAYILTIDKGDDIHDEKTWRKANPNIDEGILNKDGIEDAVKQTEMNPSTLPFVLVKHFNVWTEMASNWLPEKFFKDLYRDVHWSDFEGKFCYVGVDLSETFDLTALAVMAESDGKLIGKVKYYLPQTALENGENTGVYEAWGKDGYLTLQPKDRVDKNEILKDLDSIRKSGAIIQKIYYDKWHAEDWAENARNLGYDAEPYGQSNGNFTIPVRTFEEMAADGTLKLDSNPVTDFCLRNVVLDIDKYGNVKPDKAKSVNKIDGVIALMQAFAAYKLNLVPDYS